MFNPSYANQFSNDSTINNCIKIAKDNGYSGIEIINMLTLRDPSIKRVISEDSNIFDFIDEKNLKIFLNDKNILIAWGGCGNLIKEEKEKKLSLQNRILSILPKQNVYVYSNSLIDCEFPRHSAPRAFNSIVKDRNKKIKLTKIKIEVKNDKYSIKLDNKSV